MRKIMGFVFILIAIILFLAIIIQLHEVAEIIKNIFNLILGRLDSYQSGYTLGKVFYLILHIGLAIMMLIIGKKWVRKNKDSDKVI